MTTVLFGNSNPQMQAEVREEQPDGSVKVSQISYRAPHLQQSETRVEMRPDFDDPAHVELSLSTDNDRMLTLVAQVVGAERRQYALGVYECEQIVSVHHGGMRPTWVWSDDGAFADALAQYFGCAKMDAPPSMGLVTNGGRDALHQQHLTTGSQPAAFNYGALSANSGSGFAAADTTLAGEITTAGGGLVRKQMTFAHTTGTNTSTLTATWTANGSDSLSVVLASWANFNASSSGTMGEESALNATATLTISGDSVTVTFTLTA
jgi:hypothetical protein